MIRHYRKTGRHETTKLNTLEKVCKFTKIKTEDTDEIEPWRDSQQDDWQFFNEHDTTSKVTIELTTCSRQPPISSVGKKTEKLTTAKKSKRFTRNDIDGTNHRRHRSQNNIKIRKKHSVHDTKKIKAIHNTTALLQLNLRVNRISINCKQESLKPVNFFKLTFSPKKYSKNIIRKVVESPQLLNVIDKQQKTNDDQLMISNKTSNSHNDKGTFFYHPKIAAQKIRKTFFELKIKKLVPSVPKPSQSRA